MCNFLTDGDPRLALLPDNIKNPDLISQIRKEYGLVSKEFCMTVTDYDLRPNVRGISIIYLHQDLCFQRYEMVLL